MNGLRWFSRGGLLLLVVPLLIAAKASATVPLDGFFVAERGCPLYLSIRKGTNPDAARLVPGRRYRVLGKNREDASHFRVRAEGASPPERWVEVGCGTLTAASAADNPSGGESTPVESRTARQRNEQMGEVIANGRVAVKAADDPSPPGRFVLAASWQPAFCELRSRRPECRGAASGSADGAVLGFSLHGLWPQHRDNTFCGVPVRRRDLAERGPWSRLPALELRGGTRSRLESVMPGTRSHLHRYQWTKHGTCYGTDADAYFRHSAALMQGLNASPVRDLFARNVGAHVSARDIRGAFDRAFGRGAGERVRVRCDGGMISELQIGLRGRVSESASLARLILAAKRRSAGCRGGRVDMPGLGD